MAQQCWLDSPITRSIIMRQIKTLLEGRIQCKILTVVHTHQLHQTRVTTLQSSITHYFCVWHWRERERGLSRAGLSHNFPADYLGTWMCQETIRIIPHNQWGNTKVSGTQSFILYHIRNIEMSCSVDPVLSLWNCVWCFNISTFIWWTIYNWQQSTIQQNLMLYYEVPFIRLVKHPFNASI